MDRKKLFFTKICCQHKQLFFTGNKFIIKDMDNNENNKTMVSYTC